MEGLDHASLRESLDLTQRNLERVVELVQGFKKLSADHIDDERRTFDLRDMGDMIIRSFQAQGLAQGIEMANDIPAGLVVNTWPGDIVMVLSNLVHNACTHGFDRGAAGRVAIDAWREAGRLHIKVSDNGRGMPPELFEKPFEPFQTTRRGEGRVGLGLFAVHNTVANKLDGTIAIRNECDGGTTALISIPNLPAEPLP